MTEHDTSLPSLTQFDDKLNQAKGESLPKEVPATGMALRLGAEFASGVLVGVLAGWLLDGWLGTRPWMMIACLCFGTAAGVKTMMVTLKQLDKN